MARDTKHGRCSILVDSGPVTVSTGWMLVDISDIVNWPHTLASGHVEITHLHIEIDPTNAYRGHVELGFLENVNIANADFHELLCWSFQSGGARTFEWLDFYEHPIVCDTRYHYGRLLTDQAMFANDQGLSGPPDGTALFYTGEGDLVLRVERTAGQVDLTLTVCYNIVQDTN